MNPSEILVGALLLFISASTNDSAASDVPSGWRTHENRDYGFALAYPKNFTDHSAVLDYKEAIRSYIPICPLSAVACFIYNGIEYKGTNFESAGLSVNILRDLRTAKDCIAIDAGSNEIREKNINGIRFHYAVTGAAGLSHWEGGPVYRTFRDGVCFEVAAGTAAFEPQVTDPPTRVFDSHQLDKQLDEIVHTFRFIGPVVDGPAWKEYSESGCGGTFELPDQDVVQTDAEWSSARSSSNEITCSSHFEDHGRKYSLSAKVNLENQNILEAWLRSSGYPALTGAKVVGRSEYFTEYRAGFYYYILGQGTLYILSMSDASGHVLSPDGDRIFRHFLRSFKIQ